MMEKKRLNKYLLISLLHWLWIWIFSSKTGWASKHNGGEIFIWTIKYTLCHHISWIFIKFFKPFLRSVTWNNPSTQALRFHYLEMQSIAVDNIKTFQQCVCGYLLHLPLVWVQFSSNIYDEIPFFLFWK